MKLLTHDNRPDLVEILTVLQEEAAEVIQASSKIIRFGLEGQNPASPHSNVRHLAIELNDLIAVMSMIIHESDLAISEEEVVDQDMMQAKVDRIKHHSTYWSNDGTSDR